MLRGLEQVRRQRDPEAIRQLLGAGEELVVVHLLQLEQHVPSVPQMGECRGIRESIQCFVRGAGL